MSKTLDQFAREAFAYRAPLSVEEWATKSVELSERVTEQAGPYTTKNHPYVCEIIEAIRNPRINRVSLCWGSQTAKTTSFYVMLGFVIDQKPKPILWVFPNEKLCKTFAADRWMPFCRESSVIAKHLPLNGEGGIDSDKFTLTKQEFSRCTMNLVGAGSSANVRSYPVSVLVLDEIDVIPEGTRRECLDRTKGKQDFTILQSSTPISETGGIWQEFMEGDRRRFHIPCPHCGERFVFRWLNDEGKRNLQWSEEAKGEGGEWNMREVERSARYVCEKCGEPISDIHKMKALRAGKWIAGNSNSERGVRSYHLNSFYSPVLTFGRIAVEYLKASKTIEGEKAFTNGWLAEPWRPDIEGPVDAKAFREHECEFERGEIAGDYRLIAADVQRDHFVWIVRGFDRDGRSYLIDNGLAYTFEDLHAIGQKYECAKGIIDTGYRTQEIYEAIFNFRPFWFGAKGQDKMQTSYRINNLDPFAHDQRNGKATVVLCHLNKDIWQQEMLRKRSGAAMNWHVYKGPDSEYIRQMLSTNLVESTNKRGQIVREWKVAGHKQDHFWDCETYCLALAHIYGLTGAKAKQRDEAYKVEKTKRRAPRRQSQDEESIW